MQTENSQQLEEGVFLEMSNFDPKSTAAQVIDFIASLFGVDYFNVPTGNAAIDLRSGLIIRPHDEYPEGDMLKLEFNNGANDSTLVHMHKLVDSLIVRHAEAMAITNPEGGNAHDHYIHIFEHFQRKTGTYLD